MEELLKKAESIVKEKHKEQTYYVEGEFVPYFYHLKFVEEIIAKNIDDNCPQKESLMLIALMHDLLEDTDYTYEKLKQEFGDYVAGGVKALTKDSSLPYSERLNDSLNRIMEFGKEVGAVKMADRICNLQDIDPKWSETKVDQYSEASKQIYDRLKDSNEKIATLLLDSIKIYKSKYKGEIMKYFRNNQNNNIYAYSKGVTVVWDNKETKWQLSPINMIVLGSDENVQEITEDQALLIAGKSPVEKINKYIIYLENNAAKEI